MDSISGASIQAKAEPQARSFASLLLPAYVLFNEGDERETNDKEGNRRGKQNVFEQGARQKRARRKNAGTKEGRKEGRSTGPFRAICLPSYLPEIE
mmetsp:Transcript_47694/g.94113  ORF Transcript_47694/g.94113 Transcript_47694/m.94113 type:complete len:96 (-) Transcript_47694:944-1231(-)